MSGIQNQQSFQRKHFNCNNLDLEGLTKVSISKSFFYALSLFHSQSCPRCIHTSEKWKGLKKNDLEIDTIDNDDEKDSIED